MIRLLGLRWNGIFYTAPYQNSYAASLGTPVPIVRSYGRRDEAEKASFFTIFPYSRVSWAEIRSRDTYREKEQ